MESEYKEGYPLTDYAPAALCATCKFLLLSFMAPLQLLIQTHTHSHTHSHICARFTHVQILNSIYPPLPPSLPPFLKRFCCLLPCNLCFFLPPLWLHSLLVAYVSLFCDFFCFFLFFFFFCASSFTHRNIVSRIVLYHTVPDPTSAIALRRLSKEPQALSTSRPGFIQAPNPRLQFPAPDFGEPPLMMTPQHCHGLSLWLFFPLIVAAVVVVCAKKI